MKNFTRVLALVVVFTMMLGSVAFAASFTDVKTTDTFAEASSVLADLGILSGYPDGTFGAEKTITRAEIAAVICRELGLEEASKGAAGKTSFDDVAADHWASGNINMASQLGIIKGDGDGKFRPEDPVKYEEAVKMIVSSLGYEPAAADKGGYPTGYLVVASERQITKGIGTKAGDAATRGDVARMIYQALDVPLMERVGFGTDATYQMMDGRNGVAMKTVLSEKLGIYKMKGYVVSNELTSLVSNASSKDGYVRYYVTDNYGIEDYAEGDYYDFVAGKSAAKDLVGYASIAYVQENAAGDDEVLVIVEEKGKNATAEIKTPENIAAIGEGSNTKKTLGFGDENADEVQYAWYENKDDEEPVLYEIDPDAVIMYNGKFLTSVTDTVLADNTFFYAPQAGNVKMLDNNRDDLYDIIYVTHYVTDIVTGINTSDKKITLNGASRITLDTETDKDLKYNITIDGKAAKFEDIKEDDVISFAFSADLEFIDILISRDSVEGSVEAYDPNELTYTIDGKDYKIAPNDGWAVNGIKFNTDKNVKINLGDEGKFYLDAFGRIVANDRMVVTSKDYGFITGYDKSSSYMTDSAYSLRIMDTEGKNTTYDVAKKLVIEVTYNDAGELAVYNQSGVLAEDVFGNNQASNPVEKYATLPDYDGTPLQTIASVMDICNSSDTTKEEREDLFAKRMVTYKINSSNEVSALSFVVDELDTTDDNEFMLAKKIDTSVTKAYNAATNTLANKYGLTDDTIVFYAPASDDVEDVEDFEIRTIDSLTDGEMYYGTFVYDVDEDTRAGMILVTKDSGSVLDTTNWAVINNVKQASKDGETIHRVYYYQNGTLTDTYTSEDCDWAGGYSASSYGEGTVISFRKNGAGEIDKITKAVMNTTKVEDEKSDKLTQVSGYVYKKISSGSALMVGWSANDQARYAIPDTANVYIVDYTKNKGYRVSDAVFADIDEASFYNGAVEDDVKVFIREYDDVIKDVVVFIN